MPYTEIASCSSVSSGRYAASQVYRSQRFGATKALGCAVVAAIGGMVTLPVDAHANQRSASEWVATWATAQPLTLDTFKPPVAVHLETPSNAPVSVPQIPSPIPATPSSFEGQTIRMVSRVSAGGNRIRLSFSNPDGAEATRLGAVSVAVLASNSDTDLGPVHRISFGGKGDVTLLPGALVESDPVDLAISPLTRLAVSIYIPGPTKAASVHLLGLNETMVAQGDMTQQPIWTGASTNRSYFWFTGISVANSTSGGSIVALGDSITDGYATTPGAHRGWTDLLAKRLQVNGPDRNLSVLNLGISGGRVIRAGAGSSALARFDRDVLARPGTKWMILLEGINDINASFFPGAPASEKATTEDIIEGYRQLIVRAHNHGIKVMGGTLLPTGGLFLYSEKTEAMRQTLNAWIRTSGMFDAVADFDAATRDPDMPSRLLPAFDPGDHVHPNDAGNEAMADAIDLGFFLGVRRRDEANRKKR